MSILVLQSVSKTFSGSRTNSRPAVNSISLSIGNELLTLLGPSGSGKTTLLRLIAGLEQPESGLITLEGNVINHVPPQHRNVAMVFQNPTLLPHLDVCDNIGFGLRLRKVASLEIERKVRDVAEKLGITDKLAARPAELSGGEAQRVALARAVLRAPKVFLLDEPFSSLDSLARKQLRQEIVCLQQRMGVPMIYVTHDQGEALAVSHRIAVLCAGEMHQLDTPKNLQKRPATRFVADFMET